MPIRYQGQGADDGLCRSFSAVDGKPENKHAIKERRMRVKENRKK